MHKRKDVPAPSVQNIVDQGQSVFFLQTVGVANDLCVGVLAIHFLDQCGVVIARDGGAGIDASGAVSCEKRMSDKRRNVLPVASC